MVLAAQCEWHLILMGIPTKYHGCDVTFAVQNNRISCRDKITSGLIRNQQSTVKFHCQNPLPSLLEWAMSLAVNLACCFGVHLFSVLNNAMISSVATWTDAVSPRENVAFES